MKKGLIITLPRHDKVTEYFSHFSNDIIIEADKRNVPHKKLIDKQVTRDEFDKVVLKMDYSLIAEVLKRLPSEVNTFLVGIRVMFRTYYNDSFGDHHRFGYVDGDIPYIVNLNLFNLQEVEEEYARGVIAHELAHVYILYGKDKGFNFLKKFCFSKQKKRDLEENRANYLAQKWGFKKEINAVQTTHLFHIKNFKNNGSVSLFDEYRIIPSDEHYLELSLNCDNCNENFLMNYHYMGFNTRAHVLRNGHVKMELNYNYPVNYKDVVNHVGFCLDCKKGKLNINNVNKNQFNS